MQTCCARQVEQKSNRVFRNSLSKHADSQKASFRRTRQAQIPLDSSRHVSTQHYLAHALWHREKSWLDVTRRVALVTQHGATRPSRQARLARLVFRGVATAWTFSRCCSWNWCKSRKQKTKLVHASTTASSSSAMLKQVRFDTLDT